MKHPLVASCFFVLFSAFCSPLSAHSSDQQPLVVSESEEELEEPVKSKPVEHMRLELHEHIADQANSNLSIYASLSNSVVPLKLLNNPDQSRTWEFALPLSEIRWARSQQNITDENILDLTIHVFNPSWYGRNAFMRRLGVGQGYFAFNVRIYFDIAGAHSNSNTITGIKIIDYDDDGPKVMQISLHGYDAMKFYSRMEQSRTGTQGFPAVSPGGASAGFDDTDSNTGNILALMLVMPVIITAAQTGTPIFQTVTSPTASDF